MEIDQNTIGYEATGDESQMSQAQKEIADAVSDDYRELLKKGLTPVVIYSLSFDAEQLLTTYGALSTYLKVLSQQESEDLEAIERTVKIMIQIKPRAVEASKSLALKAVGME